MTPSSWSTYLALLATLAAGTASAQPAIDGPLGGDEPPRPSSTERPRPTPHWKDAITIEGEFTLDPDRIEHRYGVSSAKEFGVTTVLLPDTRRLLPDGSPNPRFGQKVPVNTVADLHYVLKRDASGRPTKVGFRPIPISEPNFPRAEGAAIESRNPGSHLIDQFLRTKQGLSKDDPIFATIAYQHPELNTGDIERLAGDALKVELGQTHLGMYIGNGVTRNSPENYHGRMWNLNQGRGYPATVQIVTMKGVPAADLNRNLFIVSAILNDGVQFPSDYKNDVYQTVSLGRTLQFYRWWLEDDPKLKQDDAWRTYCAEHVTIIINVGVNLPHNERDFQRIWGQAAGSRLWRKAKRKFARAMKKTIEEAKTIESILEANGRLPGFFMELRADREVSFKPLYEREGISDPAKLGLGEMRTLPNGDRIEVVPQKDIGPGLFAPPLHNADLVKNFMKIYAAWPDVGAAASAAALLGFKTTLVERMTDEEGDDPDAEAARLGATFDRLAVPILIKTFVGEAMTQAPEQLSTYVTKTAPAQLYVAIGGDPADLVPGGQKDQAKWALVQRVMAGVNESKPMITAFVRQNAERPRGERVNRAYAWFEDAIARNLDEARKVNVSRPHKVVRYNSPPQVTHAVAIGLLPSSPHITIEEVATVFEARDLIKKPASEAEEPEADDAEPAPPTSPRAGIIDSLEEAEEREARDGRATRHRIREILRRIRERRQR